MNNNTKTIFVCKVLNKTFSNIDEFRCFWATIYGYLFYYDSAYYCMGLLGLTILLSCFGGIKEVYRWFILNQAIWDFMFCYYLQCEGAVYIKGVETCFYNDPTYNIPDAIIMLFQWILGTVTYVPYNGLFLLSMSRFFALYYNNLYKRLTKNGRVIFVIAAFNAIYLFLSTQPFLLLFMSARNAENSLKCKEKNLTKIDCNLIFANDGLLFSIPKIIKVFSVITNFLPSIQLILSAFATTQILILLAKQSKFQFKQNRKDFYNSARICTVLLVQTFVTFLIFLNTFFQITRELYFQLFQKMLYYSLPLWLDGAWGIGSANLYPLVNLIRIFIEAFVILFFMTGYREALWKFFKFIYFSLKHPQKSWKKINFNSSHSNVIIISSSRPHR